jgi:hypothetical protein
MANRRLPDCVLRELEGCAGWRVRNGGKHPRLYIKDSMITTIPGSASEYSNTWLRVRRAIRKFRNKEREQ